MPTENWIDDRDEDYAPCDSKEVRLAMKSIKASMARSGDNTYQQLFAMFWPDPVPKLKWSDLSGREVVNLFKNTSFSMWRFGPIGIMNTHIVRRAAHESGGLKSLRRSDEGRCIQRRG
jgi:hypothetical protein